MLAPTQVCQMAITRTVASEKELAEPPATPTSPANQLARYSLLPN